MNALLILVPVLAAAALGPRALIGQARPPTLPGAEGAAAASGAEAGEPDPDREVFIYPGGDRRDPFERLLPGNPAGARFEELRLVGVIHSPNPRESVALVSSRTATRAPLSGIGEDMLRLRQDVVLGDMKVIRVEKERVIVEITRFGVGERRELRLNRQRGRAGR
jgi:hypothetical protein